VLAEHEVPVAVEIDAVLVAARAQVVAALRRLA
jgi:hypothetical protein